MPRTLRTAVLVACAAGIVDAAANALMLAGMRSGELSVVGMLVALYPAGTVLLAALVLRERLAGLQFAGFALAVVASVLLAV